MPQYHNDPFVATSFMLPRIPVDFSKDESYLCGGASILLDSMQSMQRQVDNLERKFDKAKRSFRKHEMFLLGQPVFQGLRTSLE